MGEEIKYKIDKNGIYPEDKFEKMRITCKKG